MGTLTQPLHIEERIHQAAQSKRVRINEFFKDFDRLRTGDITESQFRRCISQSFGVVVSDSDFNQIKVKYGSLKKNGMINYRDFVNFLQGDNLKNVGKSYPLDPSTTRRPCHAETGSPCHENLQKVKQHYQFRGITISDCFEDFDQHNLGLVTENQFWRCFPGVPGLKDPDIQTLIDKYRDGNTNLINYINLQKALEDLDSDDSPILPPASAAQPPPKTPRKLLSVEKLLEKVQLRVYKDGIRTTEFFIDHDKLRSGYITKNQFVIGLTLICGMRCPLSREDMELITNHYSGSNGRVCYRDFCFFMENAFNVPHLETNPTATVYRPSVGALSHTENKLPPHEETQVQYVLDVLRDYVLRRRITMLYPFFKDFDRGKLFSRGVTKDQFRRLLNFFEVELTPTDCDLICKKFEEPNGTDVNYPAFVQAIDMDYRCTKDPKDEKKEAQANAWPTTPRSPKLHPELVDIPKLLERLQCEVKVYRNRVCEHFKDFDNLKSGSITKSLFKRGISSLQVYKQHTLTQNEIEALCIYYRDPKVVGNVKWSKFEEDVEKVFTERNLEKKPTFQVQPIDHITLNSWRDGPTVSATTSSIADVAIQRMMSQIAQRRIRTKPCFQDFDRHNTGYVTGSQFEQGLNYLGLESNEEERKALKALFSDSKGFNYIKLFDHLEPIVNETPKYEKNFKELPVLNKFREERKANLRPHGLTTINGVLDRIKTLVMKKRIRVLEFFKDYDKLKSGRITRVNFTRALDLCHFELTSKEVNLIADSFASPTDSSFVDYLKFSDEIESIFTVKGLEKLPTAMVVQFKVMPEWLKNNLTPTIQLVYNAAMDRLACFVKTRRMQLYPMFEDYDKCRNGTVTYSQFRRVLSVLSLAVNIADEVEYHALEQKYSVNVGGMTVFNYLAFCDDIYGIAKLDKLD